MFEFYLINIIFSYSGDISYLFDFPRSIIYPTVAILFLIAFNPKYVYDAWRLHHALERGGELPPRLAEFPIHLTSAEKYLDVKERIEQFKRQVLGGESSRLCLSSDDLNDLYLQGVSIEKYHSMQQSGAIESYLNNRHINSFMFFEIIDNNVIHREIEYIDNTLPGGIKSMTRKIDFLMPDDSNKIKFSFRYLEVNGGQLFRFFESKTKEYFPIESCYLLENILKCDFNFSMDYLESNEYQLILKIIEKLTNVEIINGYLNIEFKQAL